ncbi:MAG: hypothetical protein QM477_10750 [Planctomycetota bacterium]
MLCAATLTLTLLCQQEEPPVSSSLAPPPVWEILKEKYDANHDGKISPKEHKRGADAFANLDTDGDGFLTQADIEAAGDRMKPRPKDRKIRNRLVLAPKVGEVAPDFELRLLILKDVDVEKKEAAKGQAHPQALRLSSFIGKKPVALIFGSYT